MNGWILSQILTSVKILDVPLKDSLHDLASARDPLLSKGGFGIVSERHVITLQTGWLPFFICLMPSFVSKVMFFLCFQTLLGINSAPVMPADLSWT